MIENRKDENNYFYRKSLIRFCKMFFLSNRNTLGVDVGMKLNDF